MHLSEATWRDVADLDADLAVLPVGSTEQHGPHAPLSTDVRTASAIADRGAAAYDDEVVVAPTIPVGVAEEHRNFAGTLWVSEDTFRATVRETVSSLASHGVSRVVVVNGHGGNVAPLREACARLTRDGTCYATAFTWFDAVDPDDVLAAMDEADREGLPPLAMGHGGVLETSLIAHLAPDLVRKDRLDQSGEEGADGWGMWAGGVNLAYDTDEFSKNGTVGRPVANEALGAAILEVASTRLVEVLEAVTERSNGNPS